MTPLFRVLVFGLCLLAVSAYADDDTLLFVEAREAVIKGDKAAVEALLAKGVDVNAKSNDSIYTDRTLLHWAVAYGKKDVVELLLDKGADVNAKGKGKGFYPYWTPLHTVAAYGTKDMAELLLAKGADINAKDKAGQTPLHFAADRGNEKRDVAELLLAKGADVNAKDKAGQTPLHLAANKGKKDMAELLLAKGADVNAKDRGSDYYPDWTPLHHAAAYGTKDVAELLLAKGADINAKTKKGQAPLDFATDKGKQDIVELLKAHLVNQARLQVPLIKDNPRAALVQLTAQLKDNPANDTVRRLIIKLVDELKPAPAIPEEARKHFVEGTAIVKVAKNPAQQALAAQSFTEALNVAPWWGDAYYNLGVAQELAEQYNEAEHAFTFYLLSNPGETEQREVQDRIYALSAKRKLLGAK